MAWVKMISKGGMTLTVPESVYKDAFSHNEAYSLVEEPKPFSKPKEPKIEKGEVEDGTQIRQSDEVKPSGKSTKKTSVQRK
jgi:hypothetical protein